MDAIQTDQLWPRVAARIGSARGSSLRPLALLGRPQTTRRTWLAEALDSQAGPHAVVVKASANPFAAAQAVWVAAALSLLVETSYPVPVLLGSAAGPLTRPAASGTERGFYLHLGYSGRSRLRKQLPRSSAGERPAQEWRRELAQLRQRRDRRLAERAS